MWRLLNLLINYFSRPPIQWWQWVSYTVVQQAANTMLAANMMAAIAFSQMYQRSVNAVERL